jgi:hypothetical protein
MTDELDPGASIGYEPDLTPSRDPDDTSRDDREGLPSDDASTRAADLELLIDQEDPADQPA